MTSARRPRKKIQIVVPTRDMTAASICGGLVRTLVELVRQPQYDLRVDLVQGYPVERVRNQICLQFLETDAEFLLMIDDDIVPPLDILAMAEHGRDVVGALCYAFTPQRGIYSVAYRCAEQDGHFGVGREIERHGLLEVDLVGAACVMIHRPVLEMLPQPYFRMVMDDHLTRILEPEDFYFCRQAKAAGYGIWWDTDKPCGHIKKMNLRSVLQWTQAYANRQQLIGFL